MRRAFERSGAAPVSARTAFNIFRERMITRLSSCLLLACLSPGVTFTRRIRTPLA